MKKKIAIVILCLAVVLGVVFAVSELTYSNDFSVPENCKAIITYSNGPDEKEKSEVHFYNSEGEVISKSKYKTDSDHFAIECEKDTFNFFTHEQIYFSDGKVVNNKEIAGKYSFASEDGHDRVYRSGYFSKWNKFFKLIPHGMAYKISDLGFFDLLTVYDENEVENIRVLEAALLGIDEERGRLYLFIEDSEKEAVKYNMIEKRKGQFVKVQKSLSIKEGPSLSSEFVVSHVALDKNYLYLLLNDGYDKNDFYYMLKYRREGERFEYVSYSKLDYRKFGLKEHIELNHDNRLFNTDSYIDIYQYPAFGESKYGNNQGVITYNKDSGVFSFKRYEFEGGLPEEMESTERVINGELYVLVNDYSDTFKVYREIKKGRFEKVMDLQNKQPDMFLDDFYFIN